MTASASRPLSVLFLDDHMVFAETLSQRLLELDMVREVTTAANVSQAASMIHDRQPDVVFVDFYLDDEAGLDLLPRIATLKMRPPVGVLSACSDPDMIAAALEAGAGAWVLKNGSIEEVVRGAEALHRGEIYVSPLVAGRLTRVLLDRRTTALTPTFVDGLSPRAYAVLRCLVSGMTRHETSARLYMSPNTVRTHVQKLLRVSNTHSTLALVAAARACGVGEIEDGMPAKHLPGV